MRHSTVHPLSPVRRALPCALAGFGCLLTGAGARAEPVAAVVELFTSQGCTACRAADPVMRDLARKPGLIALTLPVTYWDYLGWRDTLGLHVLNERQRAYARARGARQVVTPQAVVDGSLSAVGSNRQAVERLVQDSSRTAPLPVPVSAEVKGDQIIVEVGARPAGKPEPKPESKDEVWLVPVLKRRDVKIEGGESGGRVASYVNVVRGLVRIGPWTGQPARFEVPVSAAAVPDADGWVVLLQHGREGRLGRILGAAKGPGL